jgi:GntR family transcriptional regulator, transcriptional repressor for pyruvate dehydrogenase complex
MAQPSTDPYASVSRAPNLSDKVTEQLTEAILAKQLKAGDRLPSERDLCEKFKVSRTVIREAVRSLAAKGLLRVTSGRGVEVREVGSSHVADSMRLLVRGSDGLDYAKVHEVRTAVEVQTAGLAAERASPEDIARLSQLCEEFERSLKEGDAARASELDFQFHRELTRATDNELLLAMLDSISDVLREVRSQSMTQPHVGEAGLRAHLRILKCISSGKPDAARTAMSAHLAEAEQVWRRLARKGKRPRKSPSRASS